MMTQTPQPPEYLSPAAAPLLGGGGGIRATNIHPNLPSVPMVRDSNQRLLAGATTHNRCGQ